MTCLALLVTCLVLVIALSSNRLVSDLKYECDDNADNDNDDHADNADDNDDHDDTDEGGGMLMFRREGNIQLNLVHPPQRHQPVPPNKVIY